LDLRFFVIDPAGAYELIRQSCLQMPKIRFSESVIAIVD
jgi:hypothetical protein